jgi:putative transcriptional regulator
LRGRDGRGRIWGGAPLAAVLVFGPARLGSAASDALTPGVFLYAAPGVDAGHFTESVVLLVRHEEEGSFGLIVNRRTRVPLKEALPPLGDLKELDLALYFGGPVRPESMLVLVRPVKPPPDARRVLPDVYFSTDMEIVKEAALRPDASSRLRVYAGYAGWGPGQLASELRQGAWVVAPGRASAVFSDAPEALWPEVHDLLLRTNALRLPPDQPSPPSTRTSKPAVGEPSAPNQAIPSATRSISIR